MTHWHIITYLLLLYTHSTLAHAKVEQQQPSSLYHVHHLSIDHDGDGKEDEKLSGTHEHPFWDAEAQQWVEMGTLQAGQKLQRLRGSISQVLSNNRQNAPPGETFTTYNFEVEDFHTYFVGESGVWVHNTGEAPCEKFFRIFQKLLNNSNNPGGACI